MSSSPAPQEPDGDPYALGAAGQSGAACVAGEPWVSVYEPVLGTTLELQVRTDHEADALAANERALAEFDRLEAIFSAFRDDSAFNRWRHGALVAPDVPSELIDVLMAAARWFDAGAGAFNPSVRPLMDLWRGATTNDAVPDRMVVAQTVASIAALPFHVTDRCVVATASCRDVDLHAIAKGYIVDCAADAAFCTPGMHSVVVNLGGDLVHRGEGELLVGIEDPHQPYDNAPPLIVVRVRNGALATSGLARRGFRIAGHWYGHVLDPRTGYPVDAVASVSVVAADAMTADVLATVVGVLGRDEGLSFATARDVAACIIEANGDVATNTAWDALVVPAEP